jgi:hypothetical protein
LRIVGLTQLLRKLGVPNKMNRNRYLLLMATIFLLMVGNFLYHFMWHWGLITIHSKKDPLSKVIRQIERQGHVTVRSNLDPSTPVNMWVTEVTLADALETLGVVTESRWRLAYFVAGDKSSINGAINTLASGEKLEGWKSVYYPLRFGRGMEDEVPVDPRKDPWNVRPVTEPNAQSYLEQAARSVAASFVFPENWNPLVKSAPKSGPITKSLPQLASAARGKYEEVFLLQKRPQRVARGERGERGEDDGPRFASNDDDGRRAAMDEREQAELAKMSAADRAARQREIEDRNAFFASLRDLTDDQKRAKRQQFFNKPENQAAMDNAQANRDSRSTPDQRAAHADSYLANKAAATGGAKP